jgi:hypothetical protein
MVEALVPALDEFVHASVTTDWLAEHDKKRLRGKPYFCEEAMAKQMQ